MTQTDTLTRLEQLLASGKDTALLRFSLGNEYLKRGEPQRAADHAARAVELDPNYSAAWKLLGKALTGAGRKPDALAAYRQGIAVAEAKGDKQAAKEMSVFARRIEKELGRVG
jgi:Flp pilus assembly protein TadD